jgi:hypothetical protein
MPLGLGPFLDQIVTLLLLIAAAIGGIHLYKKNVNPSPPAQTQAAYNAEPTATSSSAEEILRERYARGEIDRPHYLEMLQNLKQQAIESRASYSRPACLRDMYESERSIDHANK